MSYQSHVATIPLGQGGFTGEDNQDNINITDLILAKNVRFDGNVIRKVGGLTAYDANAVTNTPNCLAGIDYWPTVTDQKQVTVWSDGSVYKEVSGDLDSDLLVNSLTFTDPVTLLSCGQEYVGNNRKLLLFSLGVTPQILNSNGTTMANMTNLSVDWSGSNMPAAALFHDNRVVAWGNNNSPHTLYFSALDDHTNFAYTDPNDATSYPLPIFDITPGEAQYINACHSLGTTRLYVFKYPTGIYFIDTDQLTSLIAPVTTVRRDIGVAGPKAICKAGDLGTVFIGHDGHIYSLDMVNDPNSDLRNACFTKTKRLTRWLKENINFARLKWSQLTYDTNRGEVIATYSKSGSTLNDIALVFDVNDPSNIKIAYEDRGQYLNALWFVKDTTTTYFNLFQSGVGGVVYKANQSNRVIGTSTGYSAEFKIPSTDFRWLANQQAQIQSTVNFAQVDKRIDFIEMRIQALGNYDLSLDLYIDDIYYNTFNFNQGSAGSVLDGADTLDSTFVLGFDGFLRRRLKVGGFGRRISATCYNSGANQDFGAATMIIYFDTLGSGGEI